MENSTKSEVEIEGKNNYQIGITEFIPQNLKRIIIYLHGFGSSKDSPKMHIFSKIVSPLGIGLVTFNYPNHGLSKADKDDFTLENCLSDFDTVERYIRNKYSKIPIGLFGTSLGGYLILLKINKIENPDYFCIILRAPAIKMDECFKNNLLKDSLKDFRKNGFIYAGFSKKIRVPYKFYDEISKNKLFDIYNKEYPMLIIHGTKDKIAPYIDCVKFMKTKNKKIVLEKIEGADHRMNEPGSIENCFKLAKDYILSLMK